MAGCTGMASDGSNTHVERLSLIVGVLVAVVAAQLSEPLVRLGGDRPLLRPRHASRGRVHLGAQHRQRLLSLLAKRLDRGDRAQSIDGDVRICGAASATATSRLHGWSAADEAATRDVLTSVQPVAQAGLGYERWRFVGAPYPGRDGRPCVRVVIVDYGIADGNTQPEGIITSYGSDPL